MLCSPHGSLAQIDKLGALIAKTATVYVLCTQAPRDEDAFLSFDDALLFCVKPQARCHTLMMHLAGLLRLEELHD